MKNRVLLSLLVFPLFINADNWSFGASIGMEKIDYGITMTSTDSGVSSADIVAPGKAAEGDMSYTAPALTLDARYGKHSFAFKTSDGDSDDLFPTAGFPYDGWSRTDDADRSEESFTYSFRLTNNWSLALGTYSSDTDQNFVQSGYYPGAQEAGGYVFDWKTTHTGTQMNESSGNFLAVSYQDRLSDKLFWFGKLGYQETELEIRQDYVFSESAMVTAFGQEVGYTQAFIDDYFSQVVNDGQGNAFNWDIDYAIEAEGNATIIGFGLVYVLNPKNTITFTYEKKNFSYDRGEITDFRYAGTSPANIEDVGNITDASTGTEIDESSDYFSITYRYQF